MAKDPAMLWYWGDWYSGTSLMSRFVKGCYMDLLHAQFNNGHLSIEEIKVCLGSDFGQSWPALQKKFKTDASGLFFNERLEREKLLRKKYCESRGNNKSGRKKIENKSYDKSYDNHKIYHMENENENENKEGKKEGMGEKKGEGFNLGIYSTQIPKDLKLTELQISQTVEFMRITTKQMLSKTDVEAQFEAFKIQNLTKKQWYSDTPELVTHFRNSLKMSILNHGTHKQATTGNKPGGGTSANLGKKSGGFGLLTEALKDSGGV